MSETPAIDAIERAASATQAWWSAHGRVVGEWTLYAVLAVVGFVAFIIFQAWMRVSYKDDDWPKVP